MVLCVLLCTVYSEAVDVTGQEENVSNYTLESWLTTYLIVPSGNMFNFSDRDMCTGKRTFLTSASTPLNSGP